MSQPLPAFEPLPGFKYISLLNLSDTECPWCPKCTADVQKILMDLIPTWVLCLPYDPLSVRGERVGVSGICRKLEEHHALDRADVINIIDQVLPHKSDLKIPTMYHYLDTDVSYWTGRIGMMLYRAGEQGAVSILALAANLGDKQAMYYLGLIFTNQVSGIGTVVKFIRAKGSTEAEKTAAASAFSDAVILEQRDRVNLQQKTGNTVALGVMLLERVLELGDTRARASLTHIYGMHGYLSGYLELLEGGTEWEQDRARRVKADTGYTICTTRPHTVDELIALLYPSPNYPIETLADKRTLLSLYLNSKFKDIFPTLSTFSPMLTAIRRTLNGVHMTEIGYSMASREDVVYFREGIRILEACVSFGCPVAMRHLSYLYTIGAGNERDKYHPEGRCLEKNLQKAAELGARALKISYDYYGVSMDDLIIHGVDPLTAKVYNTDTSSSGYDTGAVTLDDPLLLMYALTRRVSSLKYYTEDNDMILKCDQAITNVLKHIVCHAPFTSKGDSVLLDAVTTQLWFDGSLDGRNAAYYCMVNKRSLPEMLVQIKYLIRAGKLTEIQPICDPTDIAVALNTCNEMEALRQLYEKEKRSK